MERLTKSLAVLAALTLAACNSSATPQGNYGNVSGAITSTSGQPIAGVTIQADYALNSTSGADGKYTINGVPVSPPSSPAHIAVTNVPRGYGLPPARDDVQVQAGQTTQNVNFVLPPG